MLVFFANSGNDRFSVRSIKYDIFRCISINEFLFSLCEET